MHDLICIDIGNTCLHIGYSHKSQIKNSYRINTVDFIKNPCILQTHLSTSVPICYCSVVPSAEKKIESLLLDSKISNHKLSSDSCEFLPISYPNKHEIGCDRIANSIAAFIDFTGSSIVVDIGTATTFDLISSVKGYCGGVILPGPQTLLDSLFEHTSLLPSMDLNEISKFKDKKIGKCTKSAIALGITMGYEPMVQGIINNLLNSFSIKDSECINLILVGGESSLLSNKSFLHVPYLTLRGLAIAYENLSCRS